MYKIFLLVCLFDLTHSSIVRSSKDAQDYLKFFGYLPETEISEYSRDQDKSSTEPTQVKNETFTEVLSMFQQYVGIEPTGLFDNNTIAMMNMPRCGMPERIGLAENKFMNRKLLSHMIPRRRKWRTSRIYYRIETFPRNVSMLDPVIVRNEIRRAFGLWESVANIRCIELGRNDRQHAEIDISFVIGEHGDGSAFGNLSIGNVVAHAFFPDHHHFEGDIHFDNARPWTAYFKQGINLYQVAAHEIGHALGLDHSKFPNAVMHMVVHSDLRDNFELHEDDIKGIQNLYGRKRRRGKMVHHRDRQRQHPNTNPDVEIINDNTNSNSMDRYTIAGGPNPTEPAKGQMVQATIPLNDSGKESSLEKTLGGFWECFGLSYQPSRTINATDCYTRNVLKLLYSMQLK